MIRPRSGSYAVSVYDPALKRKRWVGTFKMMREAKAAERVAAARRSVSGRTTRPRAWAVADTVVCAPAGDAKATVAARAARAIFKRISWFPTR